LSFGERSPAFRRASDITETKEQTSDFSQCKTELTRTLNDCQRVTRCSVVSSLPAHSRGPGKQSNSLVVPNRRCLEPNLSRHLGNCQFGHNDILGSNLNTHGEETAQRPSRNHVAQERGAGARLG